MNKIGITLPSNIVRYFSLSIFLIVVLVAVCACTPRYTKWGEIQPSGFLRDYSELSPGPNADGAYTYLNPDKSISVYKMVLLGEVDVVPAPGVDIDPDAADRLARTFGREIRSALGPTYPVVTEPGFGVMVLRAAITNVEVNSNSRDLKLRDAGIEAELLDSLSKERIAAFVGRRTGGGQGSGIAYSTNAWTQQLKDWLDKSRGLHTRQEFKQGWPNIMSTPIDSKR